MSQATDHEIFQGVIVIGAGIAGLTAAQALQEVGLRTEVLEGESRLAQPWHRRHEQLHLNSHRDLSVLPGVRFPAGTPAFPHRSAVIDLLHEFSRSHHLPITFGATVDKVSFCRDHWLLDTAAGPRRTRHVVVATGRDKVPFVPLWKGMQAFGGEVIHSADFGTAKRYEGKAVLVVGAGNSGFDVLNHLAGVETGNLWLAARGGPALIPKRFGKVAVHRFSPMLARLPVRMADTVLAAVQRAAFGDLTKYGLPRSKKGGASRLTSDYTAIASDDGAVAAIKSGRIRVVAPIEEFLQDDVMLKGGEAVKPDIVIAATGYRTGLGQMFGTLPVLDGKGIPLFNGPQGDPKFPGLWFAGMRPSVRGCFANSCIQARSTAAMIAKAF